MFRRLGVGARRCDLGDEGLYLAEEIVAADRWLGGSDPEALGDPRARADDRAAPGLDAGCRSIRQGPLRTLVGEILRVAGLELDTARIVKRITEPHRDAARSTR